jgi:hypothetical protein
MEAIKHAEEATLRKIVMIAGAALSVALVGAPLASAGNDTSAQHAKNLAAKQCVAQKKADKSAFRATYGDHAMRNCVKGTTDDTRADLKNAAKECKSEQASDPAGFAATYGDGKNAYGKCVSSKAKAKSEEDTTTFKNAAQECKSERASDPDAFKATYGTDNSKGKNALGKCVSSKVKHADDTSTS